MVIKRPFTYPALRWAIAANFLAHPSSTKGLISRHGRTARAEIKTCMAQKDEKSESWMGPNPDAERQPSERRK